MYERLLEKKELNTLTTSNKEKRLKKISKIFFFFTFLLFHFLAQSFWSSHFYYS